MQALIGGGTALTAVSAGIVKTTVLIGLAWTVASLTRRQSAAFRHSVWLLGVAAALALPLLMQVLPEWHSAALGSVSAAFRSTHGAVADPGAPTMFSFVVDADGGSRIADKIVDRVVLVWLAGFLAVVLRLVVGLARLRRVTAKAMPLLDESWQRLLAEGLRQFRLRRGVRLFQCADGSAMPMTWGAIRPVILLPLAAAQWSEERKRLVICHELAHVARGDWVWQMLAELARGMYWFHPLAWLAASRLRQESERACDDLVLLNGIAANRYASELLALARTLTNSRGAWSTSLAFTRRSHFERRLTAMMNPSTNHGCLSSKARVAAIFLALCLLIPCATLRLPAQNASGKFSGVIYDPSGAAVSNATVIMTNAKLQSTDMSISNTQGNFHFDALPAGEYEMKVMKPGFAAFVAPRIRIEANRDTSQNATLQIGAVTENVDVVAEGRTSLESKTPQVRLGGQVQAPKIVNKVQPVYPASAKEAGSQGTVVLHAIIGMNGSPLSLRVVNSDIDPELARAAVEAVSKWRYSPTLLNGQPIEVDTTISVNFTLRP